MTSTTARLTSSGETPMDGNAVLCVFVALIDSNESLCNAIAHLVVVLSDMHCPSETERRRAHWPGLVVAFEKQHHTRAASQDKLKGASTGRSALQATVRGSDY